MDSQNCANKKRWMIFSATFIAILPLNTWAGDTISCPADEPCFKSAYQHCNQVRFDFSGINAWDHYNIRYLTSNGERQKENKSGIFTLNNVKPNRTYWLKAQGCNTTFLGKSDCSAWSEASVTTVGDHPDSCSQGLVWRDARPGDKVCVSTDDRKKAAAQNTQAAIRREPDGGNWGPNTCKKPFVWREAFPGDIVCVTADERKIARFQNKNANKNRNCPK